MLSFAIRFKVVNLLPLFMAEYSRRQLVTRDLVNSLFVVFITLVGVSGFGNPVPAHFIDYPAIPYDCAYLEGNITLKHYPTEAEPFYGLEVNATIDNETNHIVQFIVSEFTFNLVDVGDVYAGGTCKMADIHDMIKNGTITFLE